MDVNERGKPTYSWGGHIVGVHNVVNHLENSHKGWRDRDGWYIWLARPC